MVGGINTRCRLVLDVLQRAVNEAMRMNCDYFVVCGDLIDVAHPEPQVLAAIQDIFRPTWNDKVQRMRVILLLGNHEQNSTSRGDHALGPLRDVAQVIDEPTYVCLDEETEALFLPFNPAPVREWLPRELDRFPARIATDRRVVFAHFGVSDERTPPWLRDAPDSISIGELTKCVHAHDVEAVFVGNWHTPHVWPQAMATVVQMGALCPVGWKDPGTDYGRVATYTKGEIDYVIIEGPRFASVRADEHVVMTNGWERCFLEVRGVSQDKVAEVTERLRGCGLAGFRLDVSRADARVAARTAAQVARSAETLEQALDSFVRETDMIPKEVSRDAVHTRCTQYLKLGAK